MSNLAVLANVHLLRPTEQEIQSLLGGGVDFPTDETQPTEAELITRTGSAELVLVSPGTKITASYLDACPNVKYIGICGTAKENVDQKAVAGRNITLTNVSDYGDEPAAEFIFMQLEFLARGMGQYQWKDYPTELMGKTIGIIGLGALGQAIARLALAYKMNVLYYSRTRKPDWEGQGLHYKEKADLLHESNVIIISTPSNLQVLDGNDFSMIQPNSVLVQASMGNCFDKNAFNKWIAENNNFALFDYSAGNDNYNAYKDFPNVIFPKVVAGHTQETKQRLGEKVVENLKQFLSQND